MEDHKTQLMEEIASYPYRPLSTGYQEIRLLLVHNGERDGPLRCTIQHAFLEDKPRYETISYVSGDASAQDIVFLNYRKISAPASSVAALKRMRLLNSDRVLWIDVVCIDQSNIAERNRQVALMREVYSKCNQNLIFLDGMDDLYRAAGAEWSVRIIMKKIRAATDNLKTFNDTMGTAVVVSKSHLAMTEGCDPGALNSRFCQPWFRRLWVVQEAVLAPESLCCYGDQSISLLDLVIVQMWTLHQYQSKFVQKKEGRTSMLSLWRLLKGRIGQESGGLGSHPESASILDLITIGRGLLCRDPRDHIFGVMGLVGSPELISATLKPDYQRDVLEVYSDATAFALEESGLSRTSSNISHRTEDELQSGWPSWIPRWNRPRNPLQDPWRLIQSFIAYRIDGVEEDVDIVRRDNRFICRGFAIDVVKACTSTLPSQQEGIEQCASDETWFEHAEALVEDVDAKLLSTLVAGRNLERKAATAEDLAGLSDLRLYLAQSSVQQDLPPEILKRASEYARAWRRACEKRRVFPASSGRLGIGPQLTSPGDTLVLLCGSANPYVVRSIGSEYLLLGESYSHELMHVEALQEQLDAGNPIETFVIR